MSDLGKSKTDTAEECSSIELPVTDLLNFSNSFVILVTQQDLDGV